MKLEEVYKGDRVAVVLPKRNKKGEETVTIIYGGTVVEKREFSIRLCLTHLYREDTEWHRLQKTGEWTGNPSDNLTLIGRGPRRERSKGSAS